MKFVALLTFCAVAAAAPSLEDEDMHHVQDALSDLGAALDVYSDTRNSRNIFVDIFVSQAIAYLRRIINNGSPIFGIPPLDPMDLEQVHVRVPAGLINLELALHNVHATGFGGFVVHQSKLNIRALTLELDISLPRINAKAGLYDFIGDLFTAIPLFGKGEAEFTVEGLRIYALLHLKQSEDGKSVLIDKIENAGFELPNFKAHLTGVIGGGDIDKIVNAMIEDVIVDYVRRFHGAISAAGARLTVSALNPVLDQLDTWRYLERFL